MSGVPVNIRGKTIILNQQVNEKLVEKYKQWLNELKVTAPELLGDTYSNPYYTSIPEDWFETTSPRILIVGEEGFGTWGCGKEDHTISSDEIEKIQELNFNYLKRQVFALRPGDVNNSAFWRRLRKFAEYGVCCWTNIDKIHVLGNSKCALSEGERKRLHSVSTRILLEEISLLNPSHVVFFGWHGTSLQHELPELYTSLYPGGTTDNSVWNRSVVSFRFDGRTYIFSYHPNWGYRNKGYENSVLDAFLSTL